MSAPYTLDPTERRIVREAIERHEDYARDAVTMYEHTDDPHYIKTARRAQTLARALQVALDTQAAEMKQKVTDWAKQANSVRTADISCLPALLADIITTGKAIEREERP